MRLQEGENDRSLSARVRAGGGRQVWGGGIWWALVGSGGLSDGARAEGGRCGQVLRTRAHTGNGDGGRIRRCPVHPVGCACKDSTIAARLVHPASARGAGVLGAVGLRGIEGVVDCRGTWVPHAVASC